MMESGMDRLLPVGSVFWRARIGLAFIHIAIGGLLCLLDARYQSVKVYITGIFGWSFDFLNDTLGVFLLILGLHTFWRVPGNPAFAQRIRLAYAVAAVSLLLSIEGYFVFEAPSWWIALKSIWGIVRLAGVVAFVQAMVLFGQGMKLEAATVSWRRTEKLFWFLYVLPLTLVYTLALANLASGTSAVHVQNAVLVFGFLGVLCIPLISLMLAARATLAEWDTAASQELRQPATGPAVPRGNE